MKYSLAILFSFLVLATQAQECSSLLIDDLNFTPWCVVVGDLDMDGDIDLVSGSSDSTPGNIVWIENTGSNEFENHILNQGLTTIYSFQLADLENDGDLDIFYCAAQGVGYFENLGNGNFGSIVVIDDSISGHVMQSEDFNQDGLADLGMTTSYGQVVIFMNNGDGTFGNLETIGDGVSNIWAFASGDITGDGYPEIFYSSVNLEMMNLGTGMFTNDGNGGFEVVQPINFIGEYGRCIDFIDFDSDGDDDLFIISQTGYISIYENIEGTLGEEVVISSQEINSYWGEAFDYDQDGDEDLIVTELTDGPFIYIFENVNGNFEGPTPVIVADFIGGAPVVEIADLDLDGDLDIVYSNYELGTIHWIPSNYSGCMDEAACNYNEYATTDSGECCYEGCGCTDQNAINFNSEATCSVPVCSYNTTAFVYHDVLENGQFDGNDIPLANQQFELQPSGDLYFSNSDGEIEMNLSSGIYSLSVIPDGVYDYSTTAQTIEFSICDNQLNDLDLSFGVSDEDIYFELEYGIFGPITPCNLPSFTPIILSNNGNVPVDLQVSFSFDDSLSLSSYFFEADSIIGNTVYFGVNLNPQESYFDEVQFEAVSEFMIGEVLDFQMDIDMYSEGELINSYESIETSVVSCAYDPNDKYVYPVGHYDQNYFAEESELNYFIRFQNTGNAPAINVLVTDTISEFLDLNSISIVASSHDMNTSIDVENKVINFSFENIMLPDSTSNEPESHGFISFKIFASAGLPHNTSITNSANIYFDNNPPIITNETLSTIFLCDEGFQALDIESNEICLGETLFFQDNNEYVDTFVWEFNGDPISSEQSGVYIPMAAGEHDLYLTLTNPLCEVHFNEVITIHDIPTVEIFQDMATLTSTEAETYEWYLNNELLEGFNTQTIDVPATGFYHVIVQYENGCIAQSEAIYSSQVNIESLGQINAKIYPNPARGSFTIEADISISPREFELINVQQQTIKSGLLDNSGKTNVSVSDLSKGIYFLKIIAENNSSSYLKLVVQ